MACDATQSSVCANAQTLETSGIRGPVRSPCALRRIIFVSSRTAAHSPHAPVKALSVDYEVAQQSRADLSVRIVVRFSDR